MFFSSSTTRRACSKGTSFRASTVGVVDVFVGAEVDGMEEEDSGGSFDLVDPSSMLDDRDRFDSFQPLSEREFRLCPSMDWIRLDA